MPKAHCKSRRQFVGVAIASFGLAAVAAGRRPRAGDLPTLTAPPLAPLPAADPASVAVTPAMTSAGTSILAAASAALARKGSLIAHHDIVGVADFGQPSRLPRLHLVDMASGEVESLLVSHGRGSDPRHTGWLVDFSNAVDSQATSAGDYVTGDYYVGEHGRSMRLAGFDPTNSNAAVRGIVVHDAWYVGPNMVRQHDMLGCSEGCFAVSAADLEHVLNRLGPGRLLVATKL